MSRDILVNHIAPDPDQPRKHFDQATLDELAQSMAANGSAVPILVRPAGERYIIVHGERRWRAATQLGWETIPAEVRELSAEESHWLSLIENVQRADLSPIEEARAYQAYLATGITQEALGQRIGKSRTHIATKLRFLRLNEVIQVALDAGFISEGHAKQLLRVDHPDIQDVLFLSILRDEVSVHQLQKIIDIVLASPPHTVILLTMYGKDEHQTLVDLMESFSRKHDLFMKGNRMMGENVKKLYADRKARRYSKFFLERWDLDEETAADFLAFLDHPTWDQVTNRMFDYFFRSVGRHCVT
jgi:ParB/RepB/Spo0J family partition protein